MALRVAKGDVLRLRGTDQVGTVQGWATRGKDSVVELKVGREVRALASKDLEFVASAPFEATGGKAVAFVLTTLVSFFLAGCVGWSAYHGELATWVLVFLTALFGCYLSTSAYRAFIRPRKTSIG